MASVVQCDVPVTGTLGALGIPVAIGSGNCTLPAITSSTGASFTQLAANLTWSSTTPVLGLSFTLQTASGEVLGTVTGITQPRWINVTAPAGSQLNLLAIVNPDGPVASFVGHVTVRAS